MRRYDWNAKSQRGTFISYIPLPQSSGSIPEEGPRDSKNRRLERTVTVSFGHDKTTGHDKMATFMSSQKVTFPVQDINKIKPVSTLIESSSSPTPH